MRYSHPILKEYVVLKNKNDEITTEDQSLVNDINNNIISKIIIGDYKTTCKKCGWFNFLYRDKHFVLTLTTCSVLLSVFHIFQRVFHRQGLREVAYSYGRSDILSIGASTFFRPLIVFSLSPISPFIRSILLLLWSPCSLMWLMCLVLGHLLVYNSRLKAVWKVGCAVTDERVRSSSCYFFALANSGVMSASTSSRLPVELSRKRVSSSINA